MEKSTRESGMMTTTGIQGVGKTYQNMYIIKDYIDVGRRNEMGMSNLEFKYGTTDKDDTELIMYVFDNMSKIEIDYYYDHLLEIYTMVKAYL